MKISSYTYNRGLNQKEEHPHKRKLSLLSICWQQLGIRCYQNPSAATITCRKSDYSILSHYPNPSIVLSKKKLIIVFLFLFYCDRKVYRCCLKKSYCLASLFSPPSNHHYCIVWDIIFFYLSFGI